MFLVVLFLVLLVLVFLVLVVLVLLVRYPLSTIMTILRKILGKLLLNPAWIVGVMFKFNR